MKQEDPKKIVNTDNVEDAELDRDVEQAESDSEESYDILSSNGPGLVGDDGDEFGENEEEINEEGEE